ncbi:transcriptional regulator Ada / DNA-O6-methylguanine--protein-cysteine S-methyltransferase [Oleiphilus messinensis]|uniref:Transcriptional regulator Ada / DNA-O6-methylguanine--protein-cysteine S-methyltransferase n=1 Tax=Oleiphilus messinensis TaxID=141451 RepID=A0A1Y0ICP1_9GAMM|nr:methylated-DNA--[protein]-cysteine S-methyltransferase [Oleiphilus messinensis]ARU58231.1 transcriptional regulator Ada / DNA-O6-methylguanine--protein-cysteine S-methyltransferase [Oleiphilus messinensis]
MLSEPESSTSSQQYHLVAVAIEYFVRHQQRQPKLSDLAAYMGYSEFYLQRLFSEWVGLSPKQYLKFLTKEYAKKRLASLPVLDSALACGLSGTGRLHDLMVTCEGMTPGEYKRLGDGLKITFGYFSSPFGECLIATTDRGVCKLSFLDSLEQREFHEAELVSEWPRARFSHDDSYIASYADLIFPAPGSKISEAKAMPSLKLLLKGSPFQLKVWEALLRIPEGNLSSYQQVAASLNMPSASRAVAGAIARNQIGYLIPCHRVIRSNGEFHQYRWGAERKRIMIGWEAQNFTFESI